MRPVIVVVGAGVTALGANAVFEIYAGDDDEGYRGRGLALAYSTGLTLVGLGVLAAGLLWE